ncbi:MAG TPA: YceD family protein [Steroidobacteraceae bacterium]|jgi:uncharacterized protein|nr:YceD family protein [Steroidobacteraceae bacterium]
MAAPKLRDVRKLADSRAVFELDIPLAQLPDFPAEFLADGGQVRAQLSFGREQGFPVAQVGLQASLPATCQRCLEPMTLRVDSRSPVLIVESEQEADSAPAGWETFLAPEGRLDFAALAAEELSLALPIVPLHEDAAQCRPLARDADAAAPGAADAAEAHGTVPQASEQVTARPFAELRALLERGAKTSK